MENESKKRQVYDMIKKCIHLIDEEIDLHMQGKTADADIDTLKKIRVQLERMCEVSSSKVYMPNYNYIIRDSWDFMRIGEELLKVYYKYLEI